MLIQRVIFRDLVVHLLLTVAGLNLVLMMEKVLKLSRIMGMTGSSLMNFFIITLLVQPQIMVYSLPLAVLLSSVIVYGRMKFDNEMMVLRTAGMSLRRMFRPFFVLSAICLVVSFTLSLYISPLTLKRLRIEVNSLLSSRLAEAIEPGVFFTALPGITLIVEGKDKERMRGVFLYRHNKRRAEVITAPEAVFIKSEGKPPVIVLKNGLIHIASDESTEIEFREYRVSLPSSIELIGRRRGEMGLRELYRRTIEDRKKQYLIELFRRFTFPLLLLPVTLMGVPLSLLSERSRLKGLLAAISVFATYYIFLVYMENPTGQTGGPSLYASSPLLPSLYLPSSVTGG